MITFKTKLILLLGILLFWNETFAIVPIESIILGNFGDRLNQESNDPIEYVFNRDQSFKNDDIVNYKKDLAFYRGFSNEGKNLEISCAEKNTIKYHSDWDKFQVIRTIMAEMQYIGIDITSRAIPKYAKYFDFSDEEYSNLIDDLVDNNCSNNLTVISKKELKNYLKQRFIGENSFELPSIKNNPLFPKNMDKYFSEKKLREQEFKQTINIFKAMCSWGNDPYNTVLMTPFLKNAPLMSFINRQLNGKTFDWNKATNELSLIDTNKNIQVVCDNLICRKTDLSYFKSKIILSNGSRDFYQDFKNLYCDHFQLQDYQVQKDSKLNKIIKNMTFDDENLMVGQMMALITHVPEFLLGLEKFKDGENLLRSSIDYTWNQWAESQLNNYSHELYFEEPLMMEMVDRSLYFNKQQGKLKVSLDVNLGEFDRINQKIGKVKMGFNISVNKTVLKYVRESLLNFDPTNNIEKSEIIKKLKVQLEKDIYVAYTNLIIPPWKGDLALLIANEVAEELLEIPDNKFNEFPAGMNPINVEINYSIFALKYLNNQFMQKENKSKN